MARTSMREILRFRIPFLTNPSSLILSKPSSSSSFKDPPISLYDSSLNLLNTCKNSNLLFQIHARLITSGLIWKSSLAVRVLNCSSELVGLEYTLLVFRDIKAPNEFCVNRVLHAFSTSSVPRSGVWFYFEMLRDGFVPNSYSFVSLFGNCVTLGCVDTGLKCHGQALKNGVDRVLPVQNSLIHMYGRCGVVDLARKVFDEMPEKDFVSCNSIIKAYVDSGDLVAAHTLFDVMPERNVISYNILIVGYLRGGNPGCGLKLFRRMVEKGFKGNPVTMSSVITACSQSARLKEGKSVHGYLIKIFLQSNVVIDTALIYLYSKCHYVEVARRLFDRVEKKNAMCWNAMIWGHCIHGNPEDGLKLFEAGVIKINSAGRTPSMYESQGLFPDEVTFVSVLCACARARLLTEGRNYFNQMEECYGVKPNFGHYWCMANLLSLAGLPREAEGILRNMPTDDEDTSSQSSMWANLLSSCRFQGDTSELERIALSLIAKDPKNFSFYQLLVNVYAVAGQWERLARLKDVMKKRLMGRMPGCGLRDLKEIVHGLKVGNEIEWQEENELKMLEMERFPT